MSLDDELEGELVPPLYPPPADVRREVLVLRAAVGIVPPDPPALRRAIVRIACLVEVLGPSGMQIDISTPFGREAWSDVASAIRWLYAAANDTPSPLAMRRPPSKQKAKPDAGL